MPLKQYGVLCGSAVDRRLASGQNAHYQVRVVDTTTDYRIAINVKSQLSPSDLEYLVDEHFQHPVLDDLAGLSPGWTTLAPTPGGAALDFIRGNLFDPAAMVPLPFDVPGPDNDLNERIDHFVSRAIADEGAQVYAFGERWGPEHDNHGQPLKDKIFGFQPGNGVHDIHMNQGNDPSHAGDDGVYQDGALLLRFPAPEQWVAIFLKFQSQSWHTDDQTGHRIGAAGPGQAPAESGDGRVRIVAALVNAAQDPEIEFVTLLNTTAARIDLGGWQLLDRDKRAQPLSGTVDAGQAQRIQVAAPVALSNKGGAISLLDGAGLRVDGVAYTKDQASEAGRTIVF